MGKPSAVGHITRPTNSAFHPTGVAMLKSDGCYHYTGGAFWLMLWGKGGYGEFAV